MQEILLALKLINNAAPKNYEQILHLCLTYAELSEMEPADVLKTLPVSFEKILNEFVSSLKLDDPF